MTLSEETKIMKEQNKQLKRIADQLQWQNQILYFDSNIRFIESANYDRIRVGIGLIKEGGQDGEVSERV